MLGREVLQLLMPLDQGISCEISFGEREKPAVANFYYDDTPKGTMLQWSMRGEWKHL